MDEATANGSVPGMTDPIHFGTVRAPVRDGAMRERVFAA
jgi:hypothetical protein